MKCSLGICNFLEEISSLSSSIVFLYFFALITKEVSLSLLTFLWNSAFKWVYSSLSPLPFTSLLFSGPDIGAPKYMKQILTGTQREIDNDIIKIRNFITPLISMDRLSREKINKKIGVKHYTRCT